MQMSYTENGNSMRYRRIRNGAAKLSSEAFGRILAGGMAVRGREFRSKKRTASLEMRNGGVGVSTRMDHLYIRILG